MIRIWSSGGRKRETSMKSSSDGWHTDGRVTYSLWKWAAADLFLPNRFTSYVVPSESKVPNANPLGTHLRRQRCVAVTWFGLIVSPRKCTNARLLHAIYLFAFFSQRSPTSAKGHPLHSNWFKTIGMELHRFHRLWPPKTLINWLPHRLGVLLWRHQALPRRYCHRCIPSTLLLPY